MKKFVHMFVIAASLWLGACASPSQPPDDSLRVLASNSILADITRNVAGDRVLVESLLPFGADPHAYQPAPADVSKIAECDVLILNGVDYEHFIDPLLENAGGDRIVVTATDGLTPIQAGEGTAVEATGDPHMWLDVNRVIKYVENIRDGLIQADSGGAEVYRANADAYIAKLNELDAWIIKQVGTVPAGRRLLVTNHEVFGYFAERYGFVVVDTILPSFSSEAGASAQEIASAIDSVKASGAPAIFLGAAENADLAKQIASETGVRVVDTLHLESLTEGPPAPTYIEMMKYNVTLIAGALK